MNKIDQLAAQCGEKAKAMLLSKAAANFTVTQADIEEVKAALQGDIARAMLELDGQEAELSARCDALEKLCSLELAQSIRARVQTAQGDYAGG